MNSLKVVLSGLIGSIASLIFAFSGYVRWPETLVMMVAAALGGYCGTRFGAMVSRRLVACIVVVVGFGLSAHFFMASKPA